MYEITKSAKDLNLAEKLLIKAGQAELLKSDNAPVDLNVGGSLKPEQARDWYSRVIPLGTLDRYSKRGTKRLTGDINVYDVSGRNSYRPTTGTTPNDLAGYNSAEFSNVGNSWSLKRIQTTLFLPYDTIQENADNPNFKNEILDMMKTQQSNELSDLSMNGTANTGGSWVALQTGIVQKAKDYVTAGTNPVQRVVYSTAGDDILAKMDSAWDAVPTKYTTKPYTYVLNRTDFDAYKRLRASLNNTGKQYSSDEAMPYFGKAVRLDPYMPANTFFLDDLKNFEFEYGVAEGQTSMSFIDNPKAVGYEAIFNVMIDYNIKNNEQSVWAY